MNELQEIDRRILEFAKEPGRESLRTRTRSYCTPFRGTLYGLDTQAAVVEHLSKQPAQVLVLGANPNISDESRERGGKFRSLADHIATGLYSEVYWDDAGTPRPGWSASGENRWMRLLYEPLQKAGVDSGSIAFANYIPWGSTPTLKELVESMDEGLLPEVIALSDEILQRTVNLLRPRLVIAQLSIHRQLPTGLIVRHQATARHGQVRYPSGDGHKTYNYFWGQLAMQGHQTMLLHLPHPSSMKISVPARRLITDHLTTVLGQTLNS